MNEDENIPYSAYNVTAQLIVDDTDKVQEILTYLASVGVIFKFTAEKPYNPGVRW